MIVGLFIILDTNYNLNWVLRSCIPLISLRIFMNIYCQNIINYCLNNSKMYPVEASQSILVVVRSRDVDSHGDVWDILLAML